MNENDTFEDISPTIKVTIADSEQMKNLEPSSSEEILQQSSTLVNIDIDVFDRIANKLLKSGLLLTALELHAELIEKGNELPRLREFFDNPRNFEKHVESTSVNKQDANSLFLKNIPKSPSEQTFDSSDFTHYSDDDIERHGDERIAVLEFELRKAQQTINSLRASLTMSTTGSINPDQPEQDMYQRIMSNPYSTVNNPPPLAANNQFPDSNSVSDHLSVRDFYYRGSADGDSCPGEDDKFTKANITLSDTVNMFEHGMQSTEGNSFKYSLASSIKPHEKRAINYLINEYLMENNYKLTSITFSDENTDQDFDKWEDVGLNTDRPPDLLKLYRYFWQNCSSLLRSNSNATTIVSNSTKVPTNYPSEMTKSEPSSDLK